jgi:Zn-dependent peptidase ImmA (M78 family)
MDLRREEEIEREARKLRLDLERRKFQLWEAPPDDPIDRIDPFKIATHLLGAELVGDEKFPLLEGDLQGGNLPFRIGGYVNRSKNTIGISRRFRVATCRFTLAHSIGHWQLHRVSTPFVDGPLVAGDRHGSAKPPMDREASLFAEDLLMPANLVKSYFFRVVQPESLRQRKIDESLADWLTFGTGLRVTGAELMMKGREHLALMVSEWSPNGQSFPSLARRFRVSSLAMAIRLQRLKLV